LNGRSYRAFAAASLSIRNGRISSIFSAWVRSIRAAMAPSLHVNSLTSDKSRAILARAPAKQFLRRVESSVYQFPIRAAIPLDHFQP
jgi:hypothetical protein